MRLRRLRALPGLLASAPPWLLAIVGTTLVVLGILIIARPLASLSLLALCAGVSCILSGVGGFGRAGRPLWVRVGAGVLWIGVGAALIVWMGISIALLPVVLAILLVVGGIADLPRLRCGTVSVRVLAGAWIVAQIAVGVLVLVSPDLTSVTVALVFGARTVVFGVALAWRASALLRRRRPRPVASPGWLLADDTLGHRRADRRRAGREHDVDRGLLGDDRQVLGRQEAAFRPGLRPRSALDPAR